MIAILCYLHHQGVNFLEHQLEECTDEQYVIIDYASRHKLIGLELANYIVVGEHPQSKLAELRKLARLRIRRKYDWF